MAEAESVDYESPVHAWSQFPSLAQSKLFSEYVHRLTVGRDMHVIVTAGSETGVGKTTLAVTLALLWDQEGWTAEKAAVADAAKYEALYDDDDIAPGSVLILDEAEKAVDARRGSSKGNVEVSQAFAAKRYRQRFGILTAPTKSWVDKRLGADAADYWIQAQETPDGKPKGEALVYRLRTNEHYGTDYSSRTETISWTPMDHHPAFLELDKKKQNKLEGNIKSAYVHRDRVEELKENYWNKATKKARYHLVKAMVTHGLTQTETAEILQTAEHVEGLTQSQVSRYVNSDDFEEVYSK